jgi:alpha-L-rhamnosidase
VLTATGHLDVAVTVATQTTEPSWGYWIEKAGFTALGEHWPATTRSRSHHMFGSVVEWYYEDLAGMRPLEPGYRAIEFRPEVPARGLDRVSASYESVRGTVATAWRCTAAGLELDVTVPANATGRVYVPTRDPQAVTEIGGGAATPAERAESVRLAGVEGDRVVFEVGSGTYKFRVAH